MVLEWIKVAINNEVITILLFNNRILVIHPIIEERIRQEYSEIFSEVPDIKPFSYSDFLVYAKGHPILSNLAWEEYFDLSLQ